jgi:hypothetical protein
MALRTRVGIRLVDRLGLPRGPAPAPCTGHDRVDPSCHYGVSTSILQGRRRDLLGRTDRRYGCALARRFRQLAHPRSR